MSEARLIQTEDEIALLNTSAMMIDAAYDELYHASYSGPEVGFGGKYGATDYFGLRCPRSPSPDDFPLAILFSLTPKKRDRCGNVLVRVFLSEERICFSQPLGVPSNKQAPSWRCPRRVQQ